MENMIDVPGNVTLEVTKGEDKGRKFVIENKTITIGRQDTCNMILSDQYVSNKHCQIVFKGDHFTAIDLGSLNKTKINGNTFSQRNLESGDVLSLGKTEIIFKWDE